MTLDEVKNTIATNEAIMVYFSGVNCNVCKALKPKLKQTFDTEFPKIKQIYIDIDKSKDIAVEYGVFSIPTILVFFDSKEFVRKSRNLSIVAFIEELKRPYGMIFE